MKGGVLGLWAVASAILFGCGGGGSEETSTASREPQRSIDAQEQARAEGMVLQLTDLPPGWRASDPDESGDDDTDACSGTDLSKFTRVGDADSQDFDMGDNISILSSVSIYATDEEAKQVLDLGASQLTDQSLANCFEDSFREELQKDPDTQQFEVGDAKMGELSFTPPTGVEESRAFQVVLPLEANDGSSADVVLEAVVLHQGNALVTLKTVGVDDPLDPSLRDDLAQVLAGKMVAAAPSGNGSTTTGET